MDGTNGLYSRYGTDVHSNTHPWPFDTFVQMLAYKANLAGITTVPVSERNTGRTCSVCGCLNANSCVHRGLYLCSEWGKPNPLVRVVGSAPAAEVCQQ
ncbi:MAG TPA: hypothetical protein ENI37_00900 [Chloroflexi bacterium]|nr:hypothetical protein [Chloroflexota bacterium]